MGTPKRAVSKPKAPLPTPSISRPSHSAWACTTSPAKIRMSRIGSWHTEVTSLMCWVWAAIFTAICKGEGISRMLSR